MKLIVIVAILFSISLYANESVNLSDNEETVVIVKKGDTLWDICESYLGDPFLWPKVWSINPHIANAHIIEPGDKIYLNTKSGEIKIKKANNVENVSSNEGIEDLKKEKQKLLHKVPTIRTVLPKSKFIVKSNIIVTEKKFKKSGKIDSAEKENMLLTIGDKVHVKFKKSDSIKEGDFFNIFTLVKELEHPISENNMGYLLEILGEIKILSKTKDGFWAIIVSANKEISRGDKLIPKIDNTLSLNIEHNKKDIVAHVVDSFKQYDNLSSQNVVVIDKGKNDSIEKGDHFYVLRNKDELTDEDISEFIIGEAVVLKAEEKTSLAILYNSSRELKKGDILKSILDVKKVESINE